MLHAHKLVLAKIDMFCVLYKKDKFLMLNISRDIFLSFYTGHKNYQFHVKLHVHTLKMSLYMRNFFPKFFNLLKYVL
jgi:hypothetical protein